MKKFLILFFLNFLLDEGTISTHNDIDPIKISLCLVTTTMIGGLSFFVYKKNKNTDEGIEEIKFYNLLEQTPLASEIDKEFDQVCTTILKKLDIKEKITVRIFDYLQYSEEDKRIFSKYFQLDSPDFVPAFYVGDYKTVFLQKEYNHHPALKKSLIIARLIHEFEHYRQEHGYSGSYHGNNQTLKEMSADAAAAGFFDCLRCLRIVASRKNRGENGSFKKDDYDCYLQRLQEDPKICDGCRKEKEGLETKWSDYLSFSHNDQSKKLIWQKYSSFCR